MTILFDIKKKLLKKKLDSARKKSDKLRKIRKKEAKQIRELNKLRKDIKLASNIRLSKKDLQTLKKEKDVSKARIRSVKKNAKFIGKTSLEFAKDLNKLINKKVAKPKRRISKTKRKKIRKKKVVKRKKKK